jgi:hypothetical protein
MTMTIDIAFDIDVHMCDEISSLIIDDVPINEESKTKRRIRLCGTNCKRGFAYADEYIYKSKT